MNQIVQDIIYASSVIGGLGLLFGAGLGFAGKRFAVPEDEMVTNVRALLPGVNCGGCGYPGCDELAKAIVAGDAENSTCPVGGADVAVLIAEALGQEVKESVAMTAYVKCAGDESKAASLYDYQGLNDCRSAAFLSGGGAKGCKYGCLGMGSCATVCINDAISFKDGIAVVDEKKCLACGKCVKICPRGVIELVPLANRIRVGCNSRDNGKEVRAYCGTGCISCKLCEKACEFNAINVQDMLSSIDYNKCVQCGACALKCPTKIIHNGANKCI